MASNFQDALADLAGGRGTTATLITPEGTWSGSAGKADGVHAMEPDSQFGIASVTKTIVAAQLMLMVESGEIELDRPVTDYLPTDFTFDTNGATIRQLLSHRSGIPWWDRPHGGDGGPESGLELDELLAAVPPTRSPVGIFDYADTNYIVLGLVIEVVRKRPVVDVPRDGALRVDGTERLIWQPDEVPTDAMAMPNGESRDALEEGGGYLPSISDTVDGAAGGMASDSISLARW